MTPAEQQRLLDILDYWHKIEFFIPFDLRQADTDEGATRWLMTEQLAALPAGFIGRAKVAPGRQISGFTLFIGIFEQAEILPACAIVPSLPSMADHAGAMEQDTPSGLTCFARIDLNAHGEPRFDPVGVSTVPWAIGSSRAHGLASLGLSAFDSARQDLQARLDAFRAARPVPVPQEDGTLAAPLGGAEIGALYRLFTEWAGFRPAAGQPVAMLETLTVAAQAAPPSPAAPRMVPDGQLGLDLATAAPAPAVAILNSFYIDDIERAIAAVRDGVVPAALAAYLTPLAAAQRIDLYSDSGRRELVRLLHPAALNRGHWLDDASRAMSLMQQFAINAAREQLAGRGLFAVNGPPGTGKTTLLRELFADNIVRRAAVLARLEQAADAFGKKIKVSFDGDTKSAWIAPLRPELTGFEMVVASSNNGAVENISLDVNKRKQLGQAWSGARYLQGVAHRLAAEGGDGALRPLAHDEQPWGLLACALGKRANRQHFAAKFYSESRTQALPVHPAQHIRQWINAYQGVGFAQAVRLFRDAEQRVEAAQRELALYADLWHSAGQSTRTQFCAAAESALAVAVQDNIRAETTQAAAAGELAALLQTRGSLIEEGRLLEQGTPGWLARLLHSGAARRHKRDVQANLDAQRQTARAISARKTVLTGEIEPQRARAAAALNAARSALDARARNWDTQQQQLSACRARFPQLPLPASLDELEHDAFQIGGLWQDAALAHLRSVLFAKALALHEAWLADVAQKGGAGFAANLLAIAWLLENRQPDDPGQAALIWQSLFMVVPVVSTTFASFGSQFRGMGAESIGWLFIDEAGQALPQAAVGALWRARRAVVVGDPLQIEPVFHVPAKLVKALSALSPHTAGGTYAPGRVSVQRLADAASRHGALLPAVLPDAAAAGQDDAGARWIGSPLRVHRRCAEPMFSLSNRIAYDGKMVFGLASRAAPPGPLNLGPSAWIDLPGAARTRQAVPQQTELVAALLVRLYARDGQLPPLYIISPFKAVGDDIRKRVLGLGWSAAGSGTGAGTGAGRQPPTRQALGNWCRERIGTVHTFQGKEQSVVLLVLGADRDNAGAAAWAASEPNLLNVALTRAQHRFYIIGEAALWSPLPFFSHAHAALETTSAQAFLGQV